MSYKEEMAKQKTVKLRERLELLPPFLSTFFRGIADTTSILTRMGYAYDLHIFFQFLSCECAGFAGKDPRDFTLEELAQVTPENIEEFMEYLSYYVREEEDRFVELQNAERGKSRKLSAVRSMFRYYYKKLKIPADPAELVDFPTIHEKAIIRLDVDEVARLLDEVDTGEGLTQRQQKFHTLNRTRDLAIVTLLLGTGMRVSECVGINMNDLNFINNSVKVTRKGGNEEILYFGEEVEEVLLAYGDERVRIEPLNGHEAAFFLSLHRRRITERAVQLLVKKYAKIVTPLKKISPHKLRSTYGTNLYRETGDIYLVADVLGHADVNTTRKHYAEMSDDRRRMAAKTVKLRRE